MSRDFIGSKIAIITKSQCRYVGTIIGIDAQTSSIVLGNVKCLGTENRSGQLTNGHKVGSILPIVQFANSDIDDLKIVDEEQTPDTPQQQSQSGSTAPSQQPSIHDDPAIVSAVVSSSNKVNTSNPSISSRLIHNLQHMTLSDEHVKKSPQNEGDSGAPWSLLSSSGWERNDHRKPPFRQQQSDNKSKFFDEFISSNKTNQSSFNRAYQRSSHTNSTQTSRENGGHTNGLYDEDGLPVRESFFSDDRPYPEKRQQQPHRYQNGHQQQYQQQSYQQQSYQQQPYQQQQQQQQQQRYFYNNRRPPMPHQQRRTGGGGGGNRETFQNNTNDYEDDFDFETSNQQFNKLTNDADVKQDTELTLQPQVDTDHPILYDKKKSFFDNLVISEPSDPSAPRTFNRSKNTDTFGNDGYQRPSYRSNGNGYRRPNNHYRQNNNNSNNNAYHYRY